METLIQLSISLIGGLMLSRVAKKLNLPAVTAYLVAGLLLGPYCIGAFGLSGLGFNSMESVEALGIMSQVALGFIAFTIGNEFRVEQLKHMGRQAVTVGIAQAVFTTIIVDIALIVLHFINPELISISAAITLGAIAAATAPAATLMVVRQYKAKGPLTDILLPIVALDDAVGLVVFAISFGVAGAINTGAVDPISMIVNPLIEVVLSLILGVVMGLLFTLTERFFFSRSKRMAVSVTFVMLTVAISSLKFEVGHFHIAFSSLLSCMMLGTIFCNICDFSEELMERADRWTAPLLILFFVISGAELDLSVFTSLSIVIIGVVYLISRSTGKYSGALLSAKMSKCDDKIVKYLGITLLPQAGVALGMANTVKSYYGDSSDVGALVVSITLFAVLIYELVGPMLTKMALQKAGEINPEGKTSARKKAA